MRIGTTVGGLLHLTCSVANGIKGSFLANRWRSADALATQKLEVAREETVTKGSVMEWVAAETALPSTHAF